MGQTHLALFCEVFCVGFCREGSEDSDGCYISEIGGKLDGRDIIFIVVSILVFIISINFL